MNRAQARKLLRQLDGLEGNEVLDLRTLLEQVVLGETELLDVDVARVKRVRGEVLADMERRFVADQMVQSFRRLGYRVEDGFAHRAGSSQSAYAGVPGSDEHAVEIRLGGGVVDYQLVRIAGAPEADRDAQLELELCAAMSEVTADAVDNGVVATPLGLRPPGQAPLARRSGVAQRLVPASSGADRTTELKERER
jgi:hypothetical protein